MAVVAGLAAAPASGQGYPQKTIRIIVPVPPGGGNDTLARIVAQKLSDSMKQPVVIDNRPGGNTTIGTAVLAKTPPDGYTLLSAPSAHTVNAVLFKTLPYDPIKDFTPVAGIASTPLFSAVHPSLPVRSVKELVALAKTKPGVLTYASPGNGTSGHLAGELFKSVTGAQIVHIPYKGGAQAAADLVGGHVLMMFPTLQSGMSYVTAGKLRALAVTSPKRSALAPELPTMAQAGVPGVEIGSWFALLAPAGTPRDVVARLDTEVRNALQAADVAERLRGLGYESFYMPSDGIAAYLKSDLEKWTKVIRQAGIRVE
jgi:tripartite-type tricarboxylate transporter receptor subunit TctC